MTIKTTLRSCLLATLFSGIGANMQAQELPKAFGRTITNVNPENGLARCASAEYLQYMQENNPEMGSTEDFESWLAPKVEQLKADRLAGRATSEVIIIPVVVHVIHNGDAIGSNENIADAQVLSQIEVLNQDYRRMADTRGWNDNPVGADIEIEFRLAQVDPDGNPTNGIDRVNLRAATWETMDVINLGVKPSTIWAPARYFNIWTCNLGSARLLGYAQFPATSGLGGIEGFVGSANTDGVVIGYQYFGSADIYPQGNYGGASNPYRYGRTATHEVGHALGLRHINGDNSSCQVSATDSFKDYCPDTPAAVELNYGCPNIDSCPTAPGRDMVENYMDYANDACMNIFTQDQKNRMLTVMNNSPRRRTLKTSTVWQPVASTEDFALKSVSLYPNPATDVININFADGNLPDTYTVYNSVGQLISTVKVSGEAQLTVNTSAYGNGVYFVKIDKGTQSKTLKFIKG